MSWVKQSDTLWRDYEFNRLSDGAQALWHRANSYIADQLTDGHIPPDAIKLLQTRKRYVDELVASGRWVWQPAGGWLAAGWQEFIESRDRVLARRSESIQRANKSRAAHVRDRCAPPGPGPGPISPEEEEKKLSALSLSETAPANDRARDRSARWEKAPLPQPPPNLSPAPDEPIRPWARAWQIVERFTESEGQLGHPERHREWLEQLAAAATKDSGGHTHGPRFDNAVQTILVAWRADDFVVKNQPTVTNIGKFLQKRAARPKPALAKIDPSTLSDEELAARLDAMTAANRARMAGAS